MAAISSATLAADADIGTVLVFLLVQHFHAGVNEWLTIRNLHADIFKWLPIGRCDFGHGSCASQRGSAGMGRARGKIWAIMFLNSL
jgi:hypothetical protein